MIRMRLRQSSDWHPDSELIVEEFPYTIGRHPDCSGQILHPLISRQHCRFFLKDGNVWVEDLESLNGTILNGKRLTQPQRLREGDELGLPCYLYHVSLSEVEAEAC